MTFNSSSIKVLAAVLLLVLTIGVFSGQVHAELQWDSSSEISVTSNENSHSTKKSHAANDCAIHCYENKFPQMSETFVIQHFVIAEIFPTESDSALFSLANYRLERPPRA